MPRKSVRSLLFTAALGALSACADTLPDEAPRHEVEEISADDAELQAVLPATEFDLEASADLATLPTPLRLTPLSGSVLMGTVAGPQARATWPNLQLQEVRFRLLDSTGKVVLSHAEQSAPFCLTSDVDGACKPWNTSALTAGRYTLEARTTLSGKEYVASSLLIILAPRVTSPSTFSLHLDPGFSPDKLPADVRTWYVRFADAMLNDNPRVKMSEAASSGDVFQLGRPLNAVLSDLMIALRVTGDPRIVAKMDSVMQLARAELKDYNRDGFLNWRYLHQASGAEQWYGDDKHVMDDMLAHTTVATAAYVFRANCSLDTRYCERARFWTGYLRNHFEAKWRKRNKVPTGPFFLDKNLAHPHLQWTRYNLYMHRLTGDTTYLQEARTRATEFSRHLHTASTPVGEAYVWAHSIPESSNSICHPTMYASLSVRAIMDLSLEGFSPFSSADTLKRYANMVSQFLMSKNSAQDFARDVCGEKDRAGLRSDPHTGADGKVAAPITAQFYVNAPFTSLAPWDSTGRIARLSQQVYSNVELDDAHPRSLAIPTGMMLLNALR